MLHCRKLPAPQNRDAGVESARDGAASARRIRIDGYRRTCTVDKDCVEVSVGDPCAVCGSCGGGAIAVSALDEYQRDLERLRASCPPNDTSDYACKPCAPPKASCVDGTCVSGRSPEPTPR